MKRIFLLISAIAVIYSFAASGNPDKNFCENLQQLSNSTNKWKYIQNELVGCDLYGKKCEALVEQSVAQSEDNVNVVNISIFGLKSYYNYSKFYNSLEDAKAQIENPESEFQQKWKECNKIPSPQVPQETIVPPTGWPGSS